MRAKLLRRLAVTTGLSLALVSTGFTPAQAAVAGDGAVAGSVTVSPGVDLTPKPTSFVFGATTITGVVDVVNPSTGQNATYAGQISVGTVTGGSASESTLSASGTVNGFGFSGSTTVGPVTTSVAGNVTGGTFTRVGPTVIVVLNLGCITVTVTSPAGTTSVTHCGGTVVVVALFAPAPGQNGLSGSNPSVPGGTPITNASFVGNFAVAGA